jgi:hypothetical protein
MDTWVWIVLAIVAVLVVAAVVYAATNARRRRGLQQDFGQEYDRTVSESPSRREAEAELRERRERHDEYDLTPLSTDARSRYRRDWDAAQARFVDDPDGAIADADRLIIAVMRERGYPAESVDQRTEDLSVEHGDTIDRYRTAHEISRRSASGEASTEEQRQAFVHYRALFEELVESGDTVRAER